MYGTASDDEAGLSERKERGELREPTVVDDAVLQQSLTQVNPFLRVARLADFHQPRHEFTGDTQETTHRHILTQR